MKLLGGDFWEKRAGFVSRLRNLEPLSDKEHQEITARFAQLVDARSTVKENKKIPRWEQKLIELVTSVSAGKNTDNARLGLQKLLSILSYSGYSGEEYAKRLFLNHAQGYKQPIFVGVEHISGWGAEFSTLIISLSKVWETSISGKNNRQQISAIYNPRAIVTSDQAGYLADSSLMFALRKAIHLKIGSIPIPGLERGKIFPGYSPKNSLQEMASAKEMVGKVSLAYFGHGDYSFNSNGEYELGLVSQACKVGAPVVPFMSLSKFPTVFGNRWLAAPSQVETCFGTVFYPEDFQSIEGGQALFVEAVRSELLRLRKQSEQLAQSF